MSPPRKSQIVPEVPFDKDGVHCGFLRLFHSVHRSAYGFIPIPIAVFRNGTGPTVLLTGGNHGDEYEGQIALANLVRSLDHTRISGRVIILPMLNFPAAMAGTRTSPIDEGNLNRSFPGDPDGTVTQQIAWFVANELIPLADATVDLHSGGSSLMYIPSALARRQADPDRAALSLRLLKAFAAPVAYLTAGGQGTGHGGTLSGAAATHGVVSLGSELGGSGTLTPAALRIAERGLRNVLVELGILPPEDRVPAEASTRILEVRGAQDFVYAAESGVYEPLVELGDTVKAGQPAARIHTPETPWREPATAQFLGDGFVLCKRVPGRTMRGDCLFHLGTDTGL
ncbi:succinylglutamate desuccinylase/aspartoacylase family protein [Elioraea sp.]|uniref:succinylglutamate desuccinylase/aspartoacylase family protein n=1 Tax=Elioraea sp. TaxID=2185103 RepID=UPI003F6FCEB9